MRLIQQKQGFTLIEMVVVVALVALIFSAVLPISFNMIARYRASLKAQKVLLYVSQIRRDAFLYSEKFCLTSQDMRLTVDGNRAPFEEIRVQVLEPIFFYSNGTTSGGRIDLFVDSEVFHVDVAAPLGGLVMTEGEGHT